MSLVLCKTCGYEYAHILGTIQIKVDDNYQATEVIVNNKYSMVISVRYNYRSQSNVHILFACEDGHYFIKSFDGHKGNIHEDENSLMDGLVSYLNKKTSTLSLDFEMLGNIENYFESAE